MGTPHEGRGPCRLHGGMLPHIIRKYAQEALMAERSTFGLEIDEEPLDSILKTVRLSAGFREALRQRAENVGDDAAVDSPEVLAYGAYLKQHQQIVKLAVDAGVSERQVRIMERMAETIAMAFEDAIGGLSAPPEEIAAAAARFSAGLHRLEAGDVIEGEESAT